MRLGQLSRKLNVKPTDIVDFLQQEHNLTVENGLNTKVDDKHTELVISNFEVIEEVVEEEIKVEEPIVEKEPEVEIIKEVATEEVIKEPVVEVPTKIELPETDEEPELIKAPKPEPIQGFKVVGKIDLPEPIKKEEKAVEEPTPEITTSEIEKTTEELENLAKEAKKEKEEEIAKEKKIAAKKNPIDFHEKKREEEKERKRIKAEKEDKRKKLAEEKRLKEEKKAHYHGKQKKTSVKTTPQKIVKKKAIEEAKAEVEASIEHKNLLAKIWHWFNT